MKPLTRLDKVSLTFAFVVFAVSSIAGWYVRAEVGGEEGRAMAQSIFGLCIIVVLATAVFRDLRKPKVPPKQ